MNTKTTLAFLLAASTCTGQNTKSPPAASKWQVIVEAMAERETSGDYPDGGIAYYAVFGHRFNSWFTLGVGSGVELFDETKIPLYLDFRAWSTNGLAAPFVSASVGCSFAEKDRDDLFVQPSFGIRFRFEEAAVIFSLGYRLQKNAHDFLHSDAITMVCFHAGFSI